MNRRRVEDAIKYIVQSPDICNNAHDAVDLLFDLGHIYLGNPNMADNPRLPHDGQTNLYTQEVHIDAGYLNNIDINRASHLQRLAELLAHEGFHVYGCSHRGEAEGLTSLKTWPFSMQKACVRGTGVRPTTGQCRSATGRLIS